MDCAQSAENCRTKKEELILRKTGKNGCCYPKSGQKKGSWENISEIYRGETL